MTLLPVATRELSVASRRKASYRVRVIAALLAVLLGTMIMLPYWVGGVPTNQLGNALFSSLTWLLLLGSLASGLFLTSDAISEEKREGTLGFLFLTDLTGADVLLGKLTATLVRGAYAALAVFPVLAITLLLGGVTGTQFWKTSAAIVNAMFCSLAGGLFISTFSHKATRAFVRTLLLMLVWNGLGPLINLGYSEMSGRPQFAVLNWTSPSYAFMAANPWGPPGAFLAALAGSFSVGCLFLAAAALLVRRTWQDTGRRAAAPRLGGRVPAHSRRSQHLRARFMEPNPVVWLALREKRQADFAWALAVVAVGVVVLFAFIDEQVAWVLWSTVGKLISFLFLLVVAAYAPRGFNEARRTGLFELLATTPLSSSQIVYGQWRAMLRQIGVPVMLLMCCMGVGTVKAYSSIFTQGAGGAPLLAWGISGLVAIVGGVAAALAVAADAAALCWFGMWMGLTSKNTMTAGLKNYVFVQVLPWFAISVIGGIGAGLLILPRLSNLVATNAPPNVVAVMYPLVMLGVQSSLRITKDMLFVFWARARLIRKFREVAAQAHHWSAAGMISLPPVIPTRTSRPKQ